MKNILTALLFCLLVNPVFASIPPGQWQCIAYDDQDHSYEAFGINMKRALLAASSRCSKESKHRGSCKTAQSFCEQGPISLIEDRCVVADDNGRTWNTTGTDACKTAIELCNNWQYLHGIQSQCTIKHG